MEPKSFNEDFSAKDDGGFFTLAEPFPLNGSGFAAFLWD